MAGNRVTSAIVEVLTPGTPNARVSSVIAEVLTPGVAQARVSHTVVEVLATVAAGGAPPSTGSGVIVFMMG
jgi:hypothetical protein